MNEDIELMLKIYEPNGLDWMGNEIKSLFDLTRHHIIKRENGGIDDISNYALLTKDSHILLHYLEINYNSAYIKLQQLFTNLNESVDKPQKEYYDEVGNILKKVKKDIKNKKRNRNKKSHH